MSRKSAIDEFAAQFEATVAGKYNDHVQSARHVNSTNEAKAGHDKYVLVDTDFEDAANAVRKAIDKLRNLAWYSKTGQEFKDEQPEKWKKLHKVMTALHDVDGEVAKLL